MPGHHGRRHGETIQQGGSLAAHARNHTLGKHSQGMDFKHLHGLRLAGAGQSPRRCSPGALLPPPLQRVVHTLVRLLAGLPER
jgi:hypothetical protein